MVMDAEPRVLVVEDEPSIADLIAINLKHGGFQPTVAFDALTAQREINAQLPDLVLLDWMLPGQSGESLLRQWRKQEVMRDVPVIMLTARGEESDKVMGLEAGADDYVTKPFSSRELVARIRALLRRRHASGPEEHLMVGALKLDQAAHRVSYAHQTVKLGPTEFKLLAYLMQHPERVHSRSRLLEQVWGDHGSMEERTVDVHIKRLREALGDAGRMVQTVRGAGYCLTKVDV